MISANTTKHQPKRIFTFWEPSQNMPHYIKLCIETWRKFLPEYEIIIVDYSTLDRWLGMGFFDEILYSDFSLPMQTDAIRCALLHRYSGLWLDSDTIITSNDIRKILEIQAQIVMIDSHLAFIKANIEGGGDYILKSWLRDIKIALEIHKLKITKFHKTLWRLANRKKHRIAKRLGQWDYIGNSLLSRYLKTKNGYVKINRDEINALPENEYLKDSQDIIRNYQHFYFENDFSLEVMKETKGIILLHNSWTPQKFLTMSEKEFLEQDNTLANILKIILEKE